jgi:hypothetical protein
MQELPKANGITNFWGYVGEAYNVQVYSTGQLDTSGR